MKEQPTTSAQTLSSIIKAARDVMRKDKGLNGDGDRLPMLTWIMFLKFLDDHERIHEDEALLAGKRFAAAIEPPYRWRDWAVADGFTGDALTAFINQDEAVRPDGKRGPGLFAYLKALQGTGTHDRRDTIAAVFRGTVNRMINGYLLRDVLDRINGIHFNSSEELHVLSRTYETLLKEMRDAAGDAGEFYTPRPLVQMMVKLIDPRLGETILDPACGTAGFLVEAWSHLEAQAKTVKDREMLQQRSIFGCEAKPLPFLLANMNLLLHGLDSPDIDPLNALRFPLKEIGDADRCDVLLTNPPFGGEEERGILGNFPEDMQTAETALLFLQLIMRKLKRKGRGAPHGGRAAVVVPDGTLFNVGVASRIKEQLVKGFNLHTVVRLPFGVFEPYTPIRSNVLFFDASGPTETTWFYEVAIPDGRKKYTKTKPLRAEDLEECVAWWNRREESEWAWRVSIGDIVEAGYNIDFPNPSRPEASLPDDPVELLRLINENQKVISESLVSLQNILRGI
ncbi:MAG: N-6 DNA methylase [Methyloversatilis sp.]|uniref:class I SAM-dependent DNA methyltransferase n=1 Tax=Methyloversatilis sp. TaxID=2569862 RepID=UPI0027349EB8|nr:N-6 DNA methylase [Methyloversatilis sp.]MDP2869165.1 N-6 DNA methylase [Methyloversatilis sp.]MDP3288442.1 N-6 DNA methylase [Methyloversatilis sp.]